MKFKQLKNITSNIKSEKTIMEIETILSKFGAGGIYKEFDGEGRVISFMFYLHHKGQKVPFKMPMNITKAKRVVSDHASRGIIPRRFMNDPDCTDKAFAVGWRILKDWIHAQISLLEIEFAEPLEIFLPYAFNPVTNKSMYEQIEENKDKFLALEDKNE